MDYGLAIDSEVLHFFLSLEESAQVQILRCFDNLKALPFTKGRFVVADSVGRDVEVSIVSTYLIYHWTDHAARQVNVIGLERA